MNISAPFIERPVAAWLLTFGLVLIGWMGYRMLPVSALPQVDFPTIQVTTRLPGASAETVASLLTTPLERQFGLIPGLSRMTSTSSATISAITLQFDLGKNIDVAAEDVQAAINAAGGVLPPNLPYPPSYAKVNPADPPIMTLSLSSDTLPIIRVNDVADTLMAQKLSQINGVGRVLVEGGQRRAYRIRIDPARLSAYGLTLDDVRNALAKANVALPKGSFDGPVQALTVGANDQITDPRQYEQAIIATRNNAPIRIAHVGQVSEGLENARTAGWRDGRPAVIVNVQRQPGANIVETADRIKARLPEITRALPAGLEVSILSDRTETIRASIADVQFSMIVTIILVIAVMFVFLRSVRATVIPGLALPLSLIATFAVMAASGFSLDNLSLMALTISAGFVVDDAIVMVENIVRYLEKGCSPMEAAHRGSREIGFTIVSLTVSLVAVFIPLLFMSGIVGRLFREFALTLTAAVVVSALISLTLTPMMCGQILRGGDQTGEAHSGRVFRLMLRGYEASLGWALRHQTFTLWGAAAALAATTALFIVSPKGLLPLQDTGLIIATTDARPDISFVAMTDLQRKVADAVRDDPDVSGIASFLGAGTTNPTGNTGRILISLKPRKERRASASEIITRLNARAERIPGVAVHMKPAQDIQISTRSSRTQYEYTLTDVDAAELGAWAPRLEERLRALPMLTDVASDQQDGGQQVLITIDRDRAARLGVLPQAVDDALYNAFGQRQISTVYSQVNQYKVILEAAPSFQAGPEGLASIYLRTASGGLAPLSAFATITRARAPLAITHEDQFPAVTLSFNLAPGAALGEATAAIAAAERELGLPETIAGAYGGDAAEFLTSLEGEPWLILAAAVAIYIVLGVLYESLVHPLTIMSTLPSAGVGALLALWITGQDLSLVALIGVILLMGIVKKNAIMMIDFALEAERVDGLHPQTAIRQASLLRFRPIMMTTMAALLGAVPLALDSGTGSELRNPLGVAIVGGLLLSQLLTLYTTPVIYLALERLRRRLAGAPGLGQPELGQPEGAAAASPLRGEPQPAE